MINKIKIHRKHLSFTQEELAKKLNVTRQTINAIENNKYNPTLELAMKLSRILNTTVEDLFEINDDD
ncbi:helix-turn-helix transcriptional regulator (plasmid) [Paraclostridium benzoelyticum]|uniref:helix-turn-helix transcriptional regulator n=1 Tax=Paraclostridium benzoelyticum TaxID=1629550 RepID=UPI0031CD668B